MNRARHRLPAWRAVLRRLALAFLGVTLAVVAETAANAVNPPTLVSVDRLLAKVKADHPRARILRAELRPAGRGSGRDWLYEVKIFPPDGRILKLVYDARTLQLLERIGGGREWRRKRPRLRRGWHGGTGER